MDLITKLINDLTIKQDEAARAVLETAMNYNAYLVEVGRYQGRAEALSILTGELDAQDRAETEE